MTDPAVLDTRGLLCPVPIIRLAAFVPTLPVGAVVRVLADDPAARLDIPAWCRLRGQDYLGSPADGEHLIRRAV